MTQLAHWENCKVLEAKNKAATVFKLVEYSPRNDGYGGKLQPTLEVR